MSADHATFYRKLALDTRAVAELATETAITAELLLMALRFEKLAEYAERKHQEAAMD